MLPKSERLTKKEFIGVRSRVFFRGTYFDASVISNNIPKFGCVIAKKRIKRAVDRNKAKRKVYATIRELKPHSTSSVVIYPKQTILTSKHINLTLELRQAFDTLR